MNAKVEPEQTKITKKTDEVIYTIEIEDEVDETYFQVNQYSFKQNFNALIGHYKSNFSTSP